MDPNTTVTRIVRALEAGEWEDAHESLTDLRDWLAQGGFQPNMEHQTELLSALKAHFSTKHKW